MISWSILVSDRISASSQRRLGFPAMGRCPRTQCERNARGNLWRRYASRRSKTGYTGRNGRLSKISWPRLKTGTQMRSIKSKGVANIGLHVNYDLIRSAYHAQGDRDLRKFVITQHALPLESGIIDLCSMSAFVILFCRSECHFGDAGARGICIPQQTPLQVHGY